MRFLENYLGLVPNASGLLIYPETGVSKMNA